MAIAVKRRNNNLSWSTKNWKVPVKKKKVGPRFKFQVDWVDLSMIDDQASYCFAVSRGKKLRN